MKVFRTAIEGMVIIEPRVFRDARGYFFESFSQRDFDETVAPLLASQIPINENWQNPEGNPAVKNGNTTSQIPVNDNWQNPKGNPAGESPLNNPVQSPLTQQEQSPLTQQGQNPLNNPTPSLTFVQDNESLSAFGVLRGLHFQRPPHAQTKLVRCVRGAVLDIAVDLRKGSPTYGEHVAVELSEENHLMSLIPRGFAHGFAVISDRAVLQYKCDDFYHPESEGGISILDPGLKINWPFPLGEAKLSEKDLHRPLLKDFDSPFEI